jgi:hypothetical protein
MRMRIKCETLDMRLWELHIAHVHTSHRVSSESLTCLVVDTPPRLQRHEGSPGGHRARRACQLRTRPPFSIIISTPSQGKVAVRSPRWWVSASISVIPLSCKAGCPILLSFGRRWVWRCGRCSVVVKGSSVPEIRCRRWYRALAKTCAR